MKNIAKFLLVSVFTGMIFSVSGQMRKVEPPPVLTPGEPEDGLQDWVVLTPSNQTAVLKTRELEFSEEIVPVSVWRYKTTGSQPFMNRSLSAQIRIDDLGSQNALLVYSYSNSADFLYAGILNGSWELGRCSGDNFQTAMLSEQEMPASSMEYKMNLEIREHDVVFRAYGTNDSIVVELKKVIPNIKHDNLDCGTAVFGNADEMPQIQNFCIKRLFGRNDGIRRTENNNDERVYLREGEEVPE